MAKNVYQQYTVGMHERINVKTFERIRSGQKL